MNPRSGGTIKVTCENAFPVSRMHRNNMEAVEMRDSGCGWYKIVAILALPAFLAACEQQAEVPEAAARQVRSIVIEKRQAAEDLTLTGRIEAEDEVPLAFRISGRVLENNGKLGARVTAGDLVARLESQNEENQLRADTAALAAAEAQYNQARGHYERQSTLFRQGWATRATFEIAEKGMKTAASQVEAAQARLSAAEDLLGFTELRADQDGVYTAVGPSAGEVVQAGQMIVRLARQDGRDAVFDVPAQVIRNAPADIAITVSLADDPSISVRGNVREVAPQADPVTRTFEVKVSLEDPPEAMRLGATVNGTIQTAEAPVIEIPAGALTRANQQPAVWVVDPAAFTVSLRPIAIKRHGEYLVAVADGLGAGDIVVTAGVQALHEGQKVRLIGSQP
jgi:membrane fusion protein, multidrug efflux system